MYPNDHLMYSGKHFSVFQHLQKIKNGEDRTFEYVWRVDGTRTLAFNTAGEILLTREYRYELGGLDWRLPGGKFDSPDEDPVGAAKRELLEETGVVAGHWRYLWKTTPDSTVRFNRHFLLATELLFQEQLLSDGESIKVHWLSLKKACEMALSGEISEEISALAILKIANRNEIVGVVKNEFF
jgi:ADP-ribose pyrophosphatase